MSDEIGENITLEDMIPSEKNEIEKMESDLDNEFLINKLMENLVETREKKVCELYLKGYKQNKIAKIIGCSQPQVSRLIKKIKKVL